MDGVILPVVTLFNPLIHATPVFAGARYSKSYTKDKLDQVVCVGTSMKKGSLVYKANFIL